MISERSSIDSGRTTFASGIPSLPAACGERAEPSFEGAPGEGFRSSTNLQPSPGALLARRPLPEGEARSISSTCFPISAVLVVPCFPILVQPRRVGKIFAGFKRPVGLNKGLTRINVSRLGLVKDRIIKTFFLVAVACLTLRETPATTQ